MRSGSDAALTTRETEAVCERLPLVPVIVPEKLPVEVVAVVLTVMVAEPVAGLGLKLALAPAGNPLALKLTTPVKPPEGEMITVSAALPTWVTVREAGVAERLKSGT